MTQSILKQAHDLACAGRFADMHTLCRQILAIEQVSTRQLLEVSSLFQAFGFLSDAERILHDHPTNQNAQANLTSIDRDRGDHQRSRQAYLNLLKQYPDNAILRRNALISFEYDPDVSAKERTQYAQNWGRWAINRAGGERPRPECSPLQNRPLRIGYVSADICQHTVGLFLRPVIKSHNPESVTVFVYSAGSVKDTVSQDIQSASCFRDVSQQNDHDLARQIRDDKIDVLIDLSGHSAGSRLTVFAHRPAPVQVSWLGYFATTGLSTIDAVLLDDEHAPEWMQKYFVEPIHRLPIGRLCYQPVPFAPPVASAPCLKNGYVTFGSFNNTGKYNAAVLDLWVQILHQVPKSRLILKWRTFNDETFRQSFIERFALQGIIPERLELRGPSFQENMLHEYADIDIALDPFPFTGGLTSCEALWMGVPVITWPQDRVVSRQTGALLQAIDLTELVAKDAADYVTIATELGRDTKRIIHIRQTLRQRMRSSRLMDVSGFTRQLEHHLRQLYQQIAERPKQTHTKEKIMSQTITIDGKDYKLDDLSDKAKADLASLQLVDQKIAQKQQDLAILQTARNAYANSLAEQLPKAKQ